MAAPGAEAGFVWRVLDYTRVPLLVCAGAVVILAAVPQGRDMAVDLPTGPPLRAVGFLAAVFALSLQLWFWARLMLHDRFGYQGGDQYDDEQLAGGGQAPGAATLGPWARHVIDWLPRALAGSLSLGMALLVTLSVGSINWLTIALLAMGTLTVLLLYFRRRPLIVRTRNPLWQSEDRAVPRAALGVRRSFKDFWNDLSPVHRVAMVLGLVTVPITVFGAMLWPVAFGWTFGASAVAVLCLGTITTLLQAPAYHFRARGAPIVRALLVLALVSGLLVQFVGDNHQLRTAGKAPEPEERPSLPQALGTFLEHASQRPGPHPLVVVATAGGGLRASFVTAHALTALTKLEPSFPRRVFAISGASGGALGATVWVTWLRAEHQRTTSAPTSGTACDDGWGGLSQFFMHDYLAPAMHALLHPDLLQRFFLFPWLPDRAGYLELGWERGFERSLPHCNLAGATSLARPFSSLRPDSQHWLPLLLNNGTHQQTGARILTSPLAVTPDVFPETIDFYRTSQGKDIPISTAAHNAARFPLFSPSGTLLDGSGHVLDGGYLENFGAKTALDLLTALARLPDARNLQPIVIQILNDAPLESDYGTDRPLPMNKQHGFDTWFSDAVGPLTGLLNSRSARARLAGATLAKWVREDAHAHFDQPEYVQLRLFPTDDGGDPAPLGWVLSTHVRAEMERQITCDPRNRAALQRVREVLLDEEGGAWPWACGG